MKKIGFTLSEVLIALVLIGVVAAIFIPPMLNRTNEEEYRTSAKKAISSLDKAVTLEYSLEGLTVQDYISSEELVKYLFKKRMNTIEPSAKRFTNEMCIDSSSDSIFNTADGMIFCVTNFHSDASDEEGSKCDFQNTTPCTKEDGANIWIDVNGDRKPNKVTTSSNKPKDIYQAQLFAQKVTAYGEPTQSIFYNKKYDDMPELEKDDNPDLGNNNEPDISENDSYNPPSYPDVEDSDQPENPNNSEKPNEDDFDFDDDTPDENNPYYDQYDPKKWPSWLDFLKWLWDLLIGIIT